MSSSLVVASEEEKKNLRGRKEVGTSRAFGISITNTEELAVSVFAAVSAALGSGEEIDGALLRLCG
jgi:hypothetical protein